MSLSTDALLFSIVLVLIAIQTSLPASYEGREFLLAGLGFAVLALLASLLTWLRAAGSNSQPQENAG
jgi:hypothetical protein